MRDLLEALRWPEGFVCPRCSGTRAWRRSGQRWLCAGCGRETSATAGTISTGPEPPLTQWFAAAWHVCSAKNGASAMGLQKLLGLGSYETAWTWLHKLRRAMVVPGRDLLSGEVEVDETYVGGEEPGLRRGRAKGKKVLVAIAVDRRGKGSSRLRLGRIDDVSARSLEGFITANIVPGAMVVTDECQGYAGVAKAGYGHARISIRASTQTASHLLPESTELPRCSSDGCSQPIKVPCNRTSSTTTSTSSPSASTDGTRVLVGCSYTKPCTPRRKPDGAISTGARAIEPRPEADHRM